MYRWAARTSDMKGQTMQFSSKSVLSGVLFLGAFCSGTMAVSFADYFPLTPSAFGTRTFVWTYGSTGTYQSYISGAIAVPYKSGSIQGVGIANIGGIDTLFAANSGTRVMFLATTPEGGRAYISTDCDLSAHPAAWTFGAVTDGMLLDLGLFSNVYPDWAFCTTDNSQSLLFDIHDVSIESGLFSQCVIMWYLNKTYAYVPLDFAGKDVAMGIVLPTSSRTGGIAVTSFDIYANGIGLIASGEVDATTGKLARVSELQSIDYSPSYGPQDMMDLLDRWMTSVEGYRLDLAPDGHIDFRDFAILASGWKPAGE